MAASNPGICKRAARLADDPQRPRRRCEGNGGAANSLAYAYHHRPNSDACAIAVPRAKKRPVPIKAPQILIVVLVIVPLPSEVRFDEGMVANHYGAGCAAAHRSLETSNSYNINRPH